MDRSRSAGPFVAVAVEDIRGVCKKIAPYIVHQWRDVCEEFGVPDEDLDHIEAEAEKSGIRKSELAFHGLVLWFERVGRAANKDKLLRVVQCLGLRRAEDELRRISQKNTVNALARPVTAVAQVSQQIEIKLSKQQKQKALADRLSRPKSLMTEPAVHRLPPPGSPPGKKKPGSLTETSQMRPVIKNDLCEVKVKITVSGVQRPDQTEIQSTRDDFQSTKNDYKHTCHTFVKLVMAKQNEHFRTLKRLLGFSGISMQRMNRMGFNINCFILCSNLGSFEILYQAYKSGRLKRICQTVFVTPQCLGTLGATHVDLSVQIEDGMVNEYRDILLLRGLAEHPEQTHPADDLKLPEKVMWRIQNLADEKQSLYFFLVNHLSHATREPVFGGLRPVDENFELRSWHNMIRTDIENLNYRFQSFNENSLEFLRTLRIIKPEEKKPIANLNDVISYLKFLLNSQAVASGVRVDLIREFIAIVNQVRLKFEQIQQDEIKVSFDLLLSSEGCEQFHSCLEQLGTMLDPSYNFEPNEKLLTHSLSVLEKELFANLLTYIPSLLSVLFSLSDSLSLLRTEDEIERIINYEEPIENGELEDKTGEEENHKEKAETFFRGFDQL